MKRIHIGAMIGAIGLGTAVSAQPSPALPIGRGIWVDSRVPCDAATRVRVYDGTRFGDVYFYGPNNSMGPADEAEPVSRTGRGQDGFTIVNDGPVEVKALPDRQAVFRAVSAAEGEVWRETARLCPPATLTARMRAAAR